MAASLEEAMLLLKKWKSNSSRLSIILRGAHARISFHGRVLNVGESSALCVGDKLENEIEFDLSGGSIALPDANGLLPGFDSVKPTVVNDLFGVFFQDDGTRLVLLNETPPEK